MNALSSLSFLNNDFKLPLLLFISICFETHVISQTKGFNHLTIDDGLSQNTINCIFQDRNGFLWFGTQDGLNRYDGYGFTIYRHEPHDSNSLSHSWIWDVYEDTHKNLWIATWQGLTQYDPTQDQYYRHLPEPGSQTRLHGGRPTALCEDNQGDIWVATWGGGLSRYDHQSGHFKTFRNDPSDTTSLPSDMVRTLHYDRYGTLWIGTWNGLASCQPDSSFPFAFTIYKHNPGHKGSISSNQITAIQRDSKGTLWIGTLGGGLNVMPKDGDKFEAFRFSPNDPYSVSSDEISVIYETTRGELWIGTAAHGLNIFNASDQSFDRFYHNPERENSLGSNSVFSIFEDESGLVFVGAGGLNIYNPQLENFQQMTYIPGLDNSISDRNIITFYEDPEGFIWIGTAAGGLNKYDRVRKTFEVYRHSSADPASLSHNSVSSIGGDNDGNIWIGTRGGGLNLFNPGTGKFTHFRESAEIPGSTGLDYINGLVVDGSGQVWIATYNMGMIHFNPADSTCTRFESRPENSTTISGNYTLRIFQDSSGDMWIGTWGAGVSLYQPEKNQFTRFLHDASNPFSLCDNIVHTIYETISDTGRIIWIGTSGGLSYFNPDSIPNQKFKHIYQSDGLPSNVIYGILEDPAGHLWISSNKGICRYQPATRVFKNYDVHDGLQSNEFNAGAALELRDHQFLFGGVNGFNAFYPDQITISQYHPPVVLTSFKIFNESMDFDQSLNTVKHIDLAFKQNFFSFEFAVLDYSKPDKNQYKYKMEGIDPDWVFSGTRRYASYTKIPPGTYEFLVSGTNSEGIWSTYNRSVQIHVATPYWQTWWFQLLILSLILLILYALHRFRIRKLLELERLRLRIASDLHDDIGSALTRIVIHSEQLQSNPDQEKTASNLSKIASISREVITTMSDVIWSIDSRQDSLGDMIDRMLDFSYNTLSLKDIKFTFLHNGLDKNKKIPVDYRQNIYYIFKEAINNIVKHADATEVTIRLSNEKSQFHMQIHDNGTGFNPETGHKGHGLKNMKMRADRIRGQLDITVNNGVQINLITDRL